MTIKDIASHCGVSVSTVSRVLNNRPDVSEGVREKVLRAVEELHYVPNNTARDLVMSGSDAIGLIVRGVGNPFFTEIIPVIEHAVSSAGYTMVLSQIKSGDNELLAGASLARSKRLRGLIFLGGNFDYCDRDVAVLDVPFVCCTYTNSFGDLSGEEYSSVTINDMDAAYNAVDMLIKKGHRRIAALLASIDDRSISELRFMGYRKALEDNGIPLDPELVLRCGSYGMEAANAAVRGLAESGRDFSAIFAISDSQAIAAMKALHDSGRSVPEDCSVVAIDGIELSVYSVPTLTTFSQPKTELGKRSVEILLDMIEGRAGNRHVLLDPSLRPGGSVAPLK